MVIKRPLTDEQKKNINLPSEAERQKALDDFINYVGLKLLELEDKQNESLLSLRPKFDYTC